MGRILHRGKHGLSDQKIIYYQAGDRSAYHLPSAELVIDKRRIEFNLRESYRLK
jgi:hypothetical protein